MSEYRHSGYRPPETPEERADLIAKVRAHYDECRSRGEIGPSAEATLEELQADQNAGRTTKLDLRIAPAQKLRWQQAAALRGVGVSELIRDAVERRVEEILADEEILAGR